jgi:predicted phosphodiesterase
MPRIALISNIHGNLAALEAVTADIQQRAVDCVVNLGDSISGPLLPLQTAQFLMTAGWLSLAGNHERQLLTLRAGRGGLSDQYAHAQLSEKEFEWLRSLQSSVHLNDEVLLCHGTPNSYCEYLLETIEGTSTRHRNRLNECALCDYRAPRLWLDD